MKLVWIIGDSAVGKMTVGQELMRQTGLRLFHNHMVIEPVIEIFGQHQAQVVKRLREVVFEEFVHSDNEGMIFTYMMAFDQPSCWEYIDQVREIFERAGAPVYYVELVAPQAVRLERNVSENRLRCKPSKRDVAASRARLIADDEKYRCVSEEGEMPFAEYLRLDNTVILPVEAARLIRERFGL